MFSASQQGETLVGTIVPVSKTKFIADGSDGFKTYMRFDVDAGGRVLAFHFLGHKPRRFEKK